MLGTDAGSSSKVSSTPAFQPPEALSGGNLPEDPGKRCIGFGQCWGKRGGALLKAVPCLMHTSHSRPHCLVVGFGFRIFVGFGPAAACSPALVCAESADVWSLGVCLYCFIYGRLPFMGSCLLDVSNAIRTEPVSARRA